MAMIEFRTLGTLDLRRTDGLELHSLVAQPKRIALLTYLCVATPRGFHRRDRLLGLFWPDADQTHARTSLRNALHVLRHTLGETALVSRGDEEIAVDFNVLWCDAVVFEELLKSEQAEEALRLYRGDLLAGFFLDEVPEFDAWLEGERTGLRNAAARAARVAAEMAESKRNFTEALGWARKAVVMTGSDERAVRRLIELSARLGDRAGALQAYDSLVKHLASEFDTGPSAETVAVVERIRNSKTGTPRADSAPAPPSVASDVEVGRRAVEDFSRSEGNFWGAGIHGYSIDREIGRGGMATVVLARDLKHDRLVALKILRPEIAALLGTERFLNEISIAAGLRHPHILPLFDSGQANGLPYYAMPYVDGETLRGRIRRERCLPIDDAIRISSEVADALGYAHARGIIHRDIKPENILLENGHALITDFGIARALTHVSPEQRTQAGLAIGTAAYMSPEQAEGAENVDARTDIYALASVLYEMLAGDPPFLGSSAQSILARKTSERAPPLRSVRETVPPEIERAVLKALSRAPSDRYSTMGELAEALKSPEETVGHRRRWIWLAAAALIGVVSLAVWQGRAQITDLDSAVTFTDRRQLTNSGDVAHSAISPNGKTLAYVAMRCRTVDCFYRLELKETDGSASRLVLDSIGELARPGIQWSADGSKLLVDGKVGDHHGRFLVSPLGGVPRRLNLARPTSFWKGGDSLLSPGTKTARAHWILISGSDGVARDSIAVPRQADAIARIVPFPNSDWIAVGLRRGLILQWISINRHGQIADSLPPRAPGPPRASADALWLSSFPGADVRSVVRIPFDPRRGHFGSRKDTVYAGGFAGFDVTPDGGTFVFEESPSELTGWALGMGDVLRGNFPETRRLVTSTADLVFEVSPDGKRILVGRGAGSGTRTTHRWDVMPFQGGPAMPLAAAPVGLSAVMWTDSVTITTRTPTAGGPELALLNITTGARTAVFAVPDSSVLEAIFLAPDGWAWLPRGERVLRIYQRGQGVRTIPFQDEWQAVGSLASSADGKYLLVIGRKPGDVDNIRLNVMAVPGGKMRLVTTMSGGAAFAVWLEDGSIMLTVWPSPDAGPRLYRLRPSGEIIWTARVPRPVWSLGVSSDMKFVSLTVRQYRGDASMSRVVRH